MVARIIFMGTPDFAVPSLRALIQSDVCDVVAVVTQPDRPAGRGRKLTPTPVKETALAAGLPVHTFTKMKSPDTQAALAAYDADLAVVAAYGRILPKALLETPRLGCVNVHASLLPRHRGASPIAHAIIAGDDEVGVAIMQMDEGLDTGAVFSTISIERPVDKNRGQLTELLSELGAELLADTLPGILNGELQALEQPAEGATYAPLLKKADGALDFDTEAGALARRVVGLNPWPGTFTFFGDLRVQVLVASAEVADHQKPPGYVLDNSAEGLLVSCKRGGALRLRRIKPAGKGEMDASVWARGRGLVAGQPVSESTGPNR